MPIFCLTKTTSLGHGKQHVCLPYSKKWNNYLYFQQQQKRLLFQRLLQNRSMNYHWMRQHVVYLQWTSRLRYMQTRYKVTLPVAVTECISIRPVKLLSAMCVRYTIENSENCGKKLECHQNNICEQVATWVFPNNYSFNVYGHLCDDLCRQSTLAWVWWLPHFHLLTVQHFKYLLLFLISRQSCHKTFAHMTKTVPFRSWNSAICPNKQHQQTFGIFWYTFISARVLIVYICFKYKYIYTYYTHTFIDINNHPEWMFSIMCQTKKETEKQMKDKIKATKSFISEKNQCWRSKWINKLSSLKHQSFTHYAGIIIYL